MLQKDCDFGEQFLIVGDDAMLGSWDPLNAFPLEWSNGHIWTVELDLPVGRVVKFKLLLRSTSGQVYWQPGPDRIIEARDTVNTIVVSEDWDDSEKQVISEETSAISSENGILMGSVLTNHVEETEEMNQKSNADEDANIDDEEKPSNLEQGPLLLPGLEHLPSNLEQGPLLLPGLEHLPSNLEEGPLLMPGLEHLPSNLKEGPLLVPGLEHLPSNLKEGSLLMPALEHHPSNLEDGPSLMPGLEHLPLSESGLAEVSNPPEQVEVTLPRGNIAVEGTMALSEEHVNDVQCDDSMEAASSCDALAEESTPAKCFREPNNYGWDFQWLKKLLPTIVFGQEPPVG
ncbi:hypothetical protein HPP92_019391 [Vanilla planifolia]|uniref:CBM20 domain-containing protein n=1 Tax=Vanilla planifolia TaxID=51239 RepID=A0A835Q9I1_VANPL|nr:hypothetical protein HPP92_019391 [Vanilla planifolia]